jgi:hypothetical protein
MLSLDTPDVHQDRRDTPIVVGAEQRPGAASAARQRAHGVLQHAA